MAVKSGRIRHNSPEFFAACQGKKPGGRVFNSPFQIPAGQQFLNTLAEFFVAQPDEVHLGYSVQGCRRARLRSGYFLEAIRG